MSRPVVSAGGLSVGGETFLQTAAHGGDLDAVVSEGAASRSVEELLQRPRGGWPAVAFSMVNTPGTAVFSDSEPPPHLVDLVDEIAPRPMFLIYATKGTGGEEKRASRAFYRAARGPKAIWEIPEADHVGGLEARPREYEQRVTGFFDRSLRGEEAARSRDTRLATGHMGRVAAGPGCRPISRVTRSPTADSGGERTRWQKDHGPSVKNDKQYEGLRGRG